MSLWLKQPRTTGRDFAFAVLLMALSSVACDPEAQEAPVPTATLAPAASIPTGAAPTSPSSPVPAPTPTAAAPAVYVVEGGDNPTLIAEKLGVTIAEQETWIAELLALNDTEATALQLGQELILPGPAGQTPAGSPSGEATPASVARTETPAADDPAQPTPVPPTQAPSTPVPGSTPAASAGGFGTGTQIVGVDVLPGTYRTRSPSGFCYWARLSGFGGAVGDIISNSIDGGYSVVTIAPTDAGFESNGCEDWSADLSAVTAGPDAPFGDGTYIVGVDVSAGTWRADAAGDTCYWARLAGFGGDLGDIISNDLNATVVTISPSDAGFSTLGCGTWSRIQ